MALIPSIHSRLSGDLLIQGFAPGGVYDRDIRPLGMGETPNAYESTGLLRPLLMVDDTGGSADPFGPNGAYGEYVFVWAFGPRTTNGRTAVRNLIERSTVLLHNWHEPTTRARMVRADRLGEQSDDADPDAVMDRLRFRVVGMYAGVTV
jgi:hypothetical protein